MKELFTYTGSPITLFLSKGVYLIELWGASSAYHPEKVSGRGGYVSGELKLKEETTMYLYIGQEGNGNCTEIYNGGGIGQFGGGGATDIRLKLNNWDDIESLRSRIIVAGGGGGPDNDKEGGHAGGIKGYGIYGKGGTQTEGGDGVSKGEFGKGGGRDDCTSNGNGGGRILWRWIK